MTWSPEESTLPVAPLDTDDELTDEDPSDVEELLADSQDPDDLLVPWVDSPRGSS